AHTYTWSTSCNSSAINVSLLATTVYTVRGTGTTVYNGVKTLRLNVNLLPVISVTSGTICYGDSVMIVASGAATYTYSGGSGIVSPIVTTSYSVTGTISAGCISASPAVSTVTVIPLPTVSVNSGTTCAVQPFYIIPTGAMSYSLWRFNS